MLGDKSYDPDNEGHRNDQESREEQIEPDSVSEFRRRGFSRPNLDATAGIWLKVDYAGNSDGAVEGRCH